MVTKVKGIPLVTLKVGNNLIEQDVKQFKYLEITLTSEGRCSMEIR